MKIKNIALLIFLLLPLQNVLAQREAKIHATASYIVGPNDNITLSEARRRCIEKAQIKGLKDEFSEFVSQDVMTTTTHIDGKQSDAIIASSQNTVKGEFLGYDKEHPEPVIDVKYENGNLIFTAEVWFIGREIVSNKLQLDWDILHDGEVGNEFQYRERMTIRFKTPSASGYVAVYLINNDGTVDCLLPDKQAAYHEVKANKEYTLLKTHTDGTDYRIRMTTKKEIEASELMIIYSPNKFAKCSEKIGGEYEANSIKSNVFQDWLLKCQRNDPDMVWDKKMVTTYGKQEKN